MVLGFCVCDQLDEGVGFESSAISGAEEVGDLEAESVAVPVLAEVGEPRGGH